MSVSVSFGSEAWSSPRVVRTFVLAVHAPAALEPKPIAALPGVWAAVGASSLVHGGPGSGAGRIAISIVNGGARVLALPRLQLALRVYRAGSPIACEDAPVDLRLPPVIEAGVEHRAPIDVSCLGLGAPGVYEVAPRLLVGDAEPVEVELGRLRIEIANDPSRRVPPPW